MLFHTLRVCVYRYILFPTCSDKCVLPHWPLLSSLRFPGLWFSRGEFKISLKLLLWFLVLPFIYCAEQRSLCYLRKSWKNNIVELGCCCRSPSTLQLLNACQSLQHWGEQPSRAFCGSWLWGSGGIDWLVLVTPVVPDKVNFNLNAQIHSFWLWPCPSAHDSCWCCECTHSCPNNAICPVFLFSQVLPPKSV